MPLLLVKEDLGLTVAMIGGVLWIAGERRRAAWLAAAGVVGFLASPQADFMTGIALTVSGGAWME